MTKLKRDEILTKISEKVENEDLAIELMEDITDSFDNDSKESELANVQKELEEKTKAFDELKEKYKERFMSGAPVKEDKIAEPEVKNYVNFTEI